MSTLLSTGTAGAATVAVTTTATATTVVATTSAVETGLLVAGAVATAGLFFWLAPVGLLCVAAGENLPDDSLIHNSAIAGEIHSVEDASFQI